MVRYIFIALFCLIFFVSSVSAYTVTSMTITPDSVTLTPGQTVDLLFTIQETFGQSVNDLVMNTALELPKWSYIIYVDGNPTAPTQSQLAKIDITDVVLGYSDNETIEGTLSGTVPMDGQSTNLTVIQIYETDENGNQLGTPYTQSAIVDKKGAITTTVATKFPTIVSPTLPQTNTTPTESVGQLIAGQNQKPAQQNSLLDQIIRIFKGLLGIKS
jgi:hypothetical protein